MKKTTKKTTKKVKTRNKAYLGLMAIVRNEDIHFLPEWLHYHRLSGVSRFYFYVQDDNVYDAIIDIIYKEPLLDIMLHQGLVDPGKEVRAYRFLMDKYCNEVEWMVLGSVHEFWFNPDKKDLKKVLKEFEKTDCGGIIVPCTQMGLCGYMDKPPLPITDHLVLQQPRQQQSQYKVIVRTSAYTGCDAEWYFNVSKPYIYQDKEPFDAYGQRLTKRCICDKIKCHNYFMREVQDLIAFKRRYDGKEDDLFEGLQQVASWSELNTDATLYSKELRSKLKVKSHNATSENTIFVSVADWPDPEEHIKIFKATAGAYGIPIKWASYKNCWKSFMYNKVIKVKDYLVKQRKNGKKYAFVLDCADVIFVKSLQEILNTFNRIYDGGVLFNCDYDGVMWPLADPLLQWHIHTNYGRNGMVNAGCYCGLITDIIKLLEQIINVGVQIITKDYRQLCTKIFSASQSCGYEDKVFDSRGKLIDDDQFLIHLIQTEYNLLIKTDKFKQLFALTNAIHPHPRSAYDRDCIGNAGILHIPHIPVLRNNK